MQMESQSLCLMPDAWLYDTRTQQMFWETKQHVEASRRWKRILNNWEKQHVVLIENSE